MTVGGISLSVEGRGIDTIPVTPRFTPAPLGWVTLTIQSTDQRANLVPTPIAPAGYTLVNRISITQSAQVWLSQNPAGDEVILKLPTNSAYIQERFKRELQSMTAFANIHVMPILDYDTASYSWYAMPRAARILYDFTVPCSVDACIEILEAVASGLDGLHAADQVHRDLKPQNILWLDDHDGARWVVGDFGIVRNPLGETTNRLTGVGGLMGTEGWAAPEQYTNAHATSVRTDVYSLAVIAAWLLTGEWPIAGYVKLPSDARLAAVLGKATRRSESDRYASLNEFVRAFVDATQPFVGEFGSLIRRQEWVEVNAYVLGRPDDRSHVIRAIQEIEQSEVDSWAENDGVGMVGAVSALLDDVINLSWNEMDSFLSWCVNAVRALTNAGRFESAEKLAEKLFETTARVDQRIPAKAITAWLAVLRGPSSEAMERALHASGSWDFFQAWARDRGEKYTDTDLIKRLRRR